MNCRWMSIPFVFIFGIVSAGLLYPNYEGSNPTPDFDLNYGNDYYRSVYEGTVRGSKMTSSTVSGSLLYFANMTSTFRDYLDSVLDIGADTNVFVLSPNSTHTTTCSISYQGSELPEIDKHLDISSFPLFVTSLTPFQPHIVSEKVPACHCYEETNR
ncbi:hypothetical protein WA538_001655 [Blastocystis sp. DL]